MGITNCPMRYNDSAQCVVPLTPQPEESDIVVLNRYYTSLKRQKDYKKRVTWFSSSSDADISKVALVEYIGELTDL